MDFNDTPEEAQFRKEAFDWLKDNAPLKEGPKDSWRASSEEEGLKEVKVWQNKLRDGGWACLHWPKVYGCLLYTSPSPRDGLLSRMPSSA